ncbi:MAG: hypothetical protein U0L09_09130 [Christensenellales bacterium]|nr:hypothetical protein [Christensenellales bacterium]
MKKMIAILLAALVMTLSIGFAEMPEAETTPIETSSTEIPVAVNSVVVERAVFEGNGFIEIDFYNDITYEAPAVVVTDAEGVEYPATLFELDNDELTFRAEGLQPAATYNIAISGVRVGLTGALETVDAEITLPEEGVPAINKVDFDAVTSELEIDFLEPVEYQNLLIEVTDLEGVVYEAVITEMENDSIDAITTGLVAGETYLVKIIGVSLAGQANYMTASMEFTI